MNLRIFDIQRNYTLVTFIIMYSLTINYIAYYNTEVQNITSNSELFSKVFYPQGKHLNCYGTGNYNFNTK